MNKKRLIITGIVFLLVAAGAYVFWSLTRDRILLDFSTPEAAFETYKRISKNGASDYFNRCISKKSIETRFKHTKVSKDQLQKGWLSFKDKKYYVVITGDTAVLHFDPPSISTPPYFLIKEEEGWKMDMWRMKETITYFTKDKKNIWFYKPGKIQIYLNTPEETFDSYKQVGHYGVTGKPTGKPKPVKVCRNNGKTYYYPTKPSEISKVKRNDADAAFKQCISAKSHENFYSNHKVFYNELYAIFKLKGVKFRIEKEENRATVHFEETDKEKRPPYLLVKEGNNWKIDLWKMQQK